MGSGRFSVEEWTSHTRSVSGKTDREVFTSHTLSPELDPAVFKRRESRDSAANPNATPIILGVDVTGSMGATAGILVRRGLGVVVSNIYERKPVTDPHVAVVAIGDHTCDRAPIQATQFEAECQPMVEQLQRIWIEGGGGANAGESYMLAWLFALLNTSCDHIEKKRGKGWLFTFGDECVLPGIGGDYVQKLLGVEPQSRLFSTTNVLQSVSTDWHVFHGVIACGAHREQRSLENWRALLGQRALDIVDIDKIPEIVVSTMQVVMGADASAVAASWGDKSTALAVRTATEALAKSAGPGDPGSSGLVKV